MSGFKIPSESKTAALSSFYVGCLCIAIFAASLVMDLYRPGAWLVAAGAFWQVTGTYSKGFARFAQYVAEKYGDSEYGPPSPICRELFWFGSPSEGVLPAIHSWVAWSDSAQKLFTWGGLGLTLAGAFL